MDGGSQGPGWGSPALKTFGLNPFRLLRIAPLATTTQASFEAEQLLTLARADIPPPVPDPLPWLPSPGLPELQQAAQAIQEPLLRLKHQLLWFDFELDPDGPTLTAALRERDRVALKAYLAIKPPRSPFDDDSTAADCASGDIAQAINQANLALLMAAATTGGGWTGRVPSGSVPEGFQAEQWQALGSLRALPNAHLLVSSTHQFDIDDAGGLWRSGLSRWLAVLADPRFRDYLVARINALEDDYADPDDAGAVEEGILTHLVDLSGQEIRFALMGGDDRLATALTAAVAQAGLPARLLNPATRPVRQFLRADLTELDPLLDQAEDYHLAPVARFLRLLTLVRDRWLVLDAAGVLGLRALLDQAAERIYLRVRQWTKLGPEADGLLEQAIGLVSAKSLQERIASLRVQQQERRERVCFYCKKNDPDYDKSVVLYGKKETHRTRKYNTTTIHYMTREAVVLRCTRCATFHQFVRKISNALAVMLLASLVMVVAAGVVAHVMPRDATPDVVVSEPQAAPDSPLMAVMPDKHGTTTLTPGELRFCLAREIEIDARRQEMDRFRSNTSKFNSNVDPFNTSLQDWKDRCGSRSHFVRDEAAANRDVEAARSTLEQIGRDKVQEASWANVLVGLAVVFGFFVLCGLIWAIGQSFKGVRWLVARRLTPAGGTTIGSYYGSKGFKDLAHDGYGVKADFRIDAIKRLENKAKKK